MNYLVDSFFSKGLEHLICQDYSCFGTINNQPYVIICDGCSSAPNTDIGARILAKVAENHLDILTNMSASRIEMFINSIIQSLKTVQYLLNLQLSNLLSTLIVCKIFENGKMGVLIYGDGVFVIRYKSGLISIHDIDFSLNNPNYLAYNLSPTLKELYPNIKNEYRVLFGGMLKGADPYLIDKDYYSGEFDLENIESVFLFSDGVKCVEWTDSTHPMGSIVDMEDVINQLINIQIPNKNCVTRRLIKFFDSEIKTKFWKPLDDISMGIIYFK